MALPTTNAAKQIPVAQTPIEKHPGPVLCTGPERAMSHHVAYTMAAIAGPSSGEWPWAFVTSPVASLTEILTAALGGIMGYAKSRSAPSLIAGLGFGAIYGVAGYCLERPTSPEADERLILKFRFLSPPQRYLIQTNKDYGAELAAVASFALSAAVLPRGFRTRKSVPLTLGVAAAGTGGYYAKKVYEFRVGV
ncbi:MAG: transmembrane proteins 14C-domain-containing protein [Olpidium bornovanus]|uniref:Transmembrane proteins 14C-domain-containing protein n=1 Tax=Olpidium bornovanus TaxID=278681 RepID=A0A8H7ZYH8_9FUNG|nr:MAG: transmembrane proteins 14C-domain-containing protein [Olpidium bornovanus]